METIHYISLDRLRSIWYLLFYELNRTVRELIGVNSNVVFTIKLLSYSGFTCFTLSYSGSTCFTL